MTTAKAGTPLDLPVPLDDAGFQRLRDEQSEIPKGLSNATLNAISLHVSPSTTALIQQLVNTTMSAGLVTMCVELSWNRGQNADIVLHNSLLLLNRLRAEISDMKPSLFISAVIGLARHNPAEKNLAEKITTVEELEGAAAVLRFVYNFSSDIYGMTKHAAMMGYSHGLRATQALVIANPHLDNLLRTEPEKADKVIAFLHQHPMGSTKKALAPLVAFLADDVHVAVDQGWL